MKIKPYLVFIYAAALACSSGCASRLNERYSLWRNDKIPYGTWYAYNHLSYLFRNAEVTISKGSPALNNTLYASVTTNDEEEQDTLRSVRSAYLVIGNTMKPDEKEINALFSYIGSGNHVFISALEIGQNLLDSLKLEVPMRSGIFNDDDSLSLSILHPVDYDSTSFSYPGKAMDNYFSRVDSSITTIVGKDKEGHPNFVKFTYQGGGSLCLQLAPSAFTNFFLLHKKNKGYYDQALSFLPADITQLKWDDYYRTHSNGEDISGNSGFSKLRAFLNHEVLRWAFWLVILLFSIIYVFESKRKQRIVPVIKPLQNTSLDFVKTIGRLYYQRKDNKNLALKMVTHFLDHVRNRYNLRTSQLSEAFEQRLSYKSGCDLQTVKDLLYEVRLMEDKPVITDNELLDFNDKLDKFYKLT